MAWIYRYSVRHPWATVLWAVLVTLGIAPGVTRLKLRTDGHALVPASAPAVRYDESIRREFNHYDPIVVHIRSDDPRGIFNVATLTLVDELTTAFERLDGVDPLNVFSLATEHNDRVWPGTLKFRRFLEPVPRTRIELERLRKDLREIRLYNGNLVSKDEKSTCILVGIPPGADRLELLRTVRETIASRGPLDDHITIIGAPVAEALLGTHILEDLGVPTFLLGHRTFATGDEEGGAVPASLHELRVWIARHVGLVPVAIAVMALVFLVSFRSLGAVALPLGEVGACLVFVFAVMGWLDVPVYLTTAVLPVILAATGITDEIHIFSRYRQVLRENPDDDHKDVVVAVMGELSRPIVMTSVTTSIAFLSFALSEIAPVRAFGIFTAVGIMFCMLWSLTVIPACLTLINPRRFVRRREGDGAGSWWLWRVFHRYGAVVVRCRLIILVVAVAAVAIAPLGVRRIIVQDSWIDGFAPESEFYQATQAFNDQFLGTHELLVCIDTGGLTLKGEMLAGAIEGWRVRFPAGLTDDPESLAGQRFRVTRIDVPIEPDDTERRRRIRNTCRSWIDKAQLIGDQIVVSLSRHHVSPVRLMRLEPDERISYEIMPVRMMTPDVISKIADLDTFIEGCRDEAVGGVIGTSDYVATVNYMIQGRKESYRRVPDRVERIEFVWSEFERVRGTDRVRQLVDADYDRSIVNVLLKNANFVDTDRLMTKIRDYEAEHLTPHGVSLSFAGDVAVSQTLIDAIVRTQVVSGLGSLAGVLVVTTLLGRSLIFGQLCVLPSSLAVLFNFAAMGWLGVPLGVATSMFSAMTLGIGVDYAIHLQARYRRLRGEGKSTDIALPEAVATTGSAISVDTLAVALGFGVMVLSQVPANARLGGLVALSITTCFLTTMLVLPALLGMGPQHPRT